jgi:hypothetical protein
MRCKTLKVQIHEHECGSSIETLSLADTCIQSSGFLTKYSLLTSRSSHETSDNPWFINIHSYSCDRARLARVPTRKLNGLHVPMPFETNVLVGWSWELVAPVWWRATDRRTTAPKVEPSNRVCCFQCLQHFDIKSSNLFCFWGPLEIQSYRIRGFQTALMPTWRPNWVSLGLTV